MSEVAGLTPTCPNAHLFETCLWVNNFAAASLWNQTLNYEWSYFFELKLSVRCGRELQACHFVCKCSNCVVMHSANDFDLFCNFHPYSWTYRRSIVAFSFANIRCFVCVWSAGAPPAFGASNGLPAPTPFAAASPGFSPMPPAAGSATFTIGSSSGRAALAANRRAASRLRSGRR